jgi:hypothetical protein
VNTHVNPRSASTDDRERELGGGPADDGPREVDLSSRSMLRRDESEIRLAESRTRYCCSCLVAPPHDPTGIEHVDGQPDRVQRVSKIRPEHVQNRLAVS